MWWVNDQLLGAQAPASVHAPRRRRRTPSRASRDITLSAVALRDRRAGTYLTGTVANRSARAAAYVPVFAVAQRGGRVVAAGRALVPKLPVTPGPKPVRFRLLFVGNPSGAKVALTVAPTAVS